MAPQDKTVELDVDLRLQDIARNMGRQILDDDAVSFVVMLAEQMHSESFVSEAIEALKTHQRDRGWQVST